MKIWTRFALLALVAGMLGGSVLSGCGGSGDDTETTTTNAADGTTTKKTETED
jgi:hypothetical protein